MTDWDNNSNEGLVNEFERPGQQKIELFPSKITFISQEQLFQMPAFNNEKLLDATCPSLNVETILPTIYFLDNNYFNFPSGLTVPGIMLSIYSFTNKIAFFLETYDDSIDDYHPIKNGFYPFLIINREDIINFKYEENHKFNVIKRKDVNNFIDNHKSLGLLSGGLIPGLITRGALNIAGKMEEDTIEKIGNVFHLKCKFQNKEIEIHIASDHNYFFDFAYFLKKQWIPIIPLRETLDETKEYRVLRFPFVLKIGDKVKVWGWGMLSSSTGYIIDMEGTIAVVKIIGKNGSEKIERIKYDKIARYSKVYY